MKFIVQQEEKLDRKVFSKTAEEKKLLKDLNKKTPKTKLILIDKFTT